MATELKSNLKIFVFLCLMCQYQLKTKAQENNDPIVMVVHGGAGTILKSSMTDAQERAYRDVLQKALLEGYDLIQSGRSSIDAVEKTIHILEDSPLFNAGKGAVFTHDGRNELDASIMDGATGNAGAVAGVTTVKNPISAAKAVMQQSEHVMMAGQGAELFAKSIGLEMVDPSYFRTESRWQSLQQLLKEESERMKLDHDQQSALPDKSKDEKFGTVGCVAIDQQQHIAAGTSTGGMTNKKYGRVGDSPIIAAGTYANEHVGVSCTGWGEYFIRAVAAYDVAARMNYLQEDVKTAAQQVIDHIEKMGGNGGLIALDKNGHVAMPFNTAGMYRATITKSGKIDIQIYK